MSRAMLLFLAFSPPLPADPGEGVLSEGVLLLLLQSLLLLGCGSLCAEYPIQGTKEYLIAERGL